MLSQALRAIPVQASLRAAGVSESCDPADVGSGWVLPSFFLPPSPHLPRQFQVILVSTKFLPLVMGRKSISSNNSSL